MSGIPSSMNRANESVWWYARPLEASMSLMMGHRFTEGSLM